MATDLRQVEEMVARCVGIAVYYHGETAATSRAAMEAEFRAVATRVGAMGLGVVALGDRFLRPLEDELVARYGVEEGRELRAEVARLLGGNAALPVRAVS